MLPEDLTWHTNNSVLRATWTIEDGSYFSVSGKNYHKASFRISVKKICHSDSLPLV